MTKAFIHHSGWSVANTIANRRMYNKDLTNPGVGNARRQMDILNEREREKKTTLYCMHILLCSSLSPFSDKYCCLSPEGALGSSETQISI